MSCCIDIETMSSLSCGMYKQKSLPDGCNQTRIWLQPYRVEYIPLDHRLHCGYDAWFCGFLPTKPALALTNATLTRDSEDPLPEYNPLPLECSSVWTPKRP
jgi:hypothetical protein